MAKQNKRPRPKEGEGVRGQFRALVREVRELAVPHLDKFAQRNYQNAKIKALGGKLKKDQKRPLPVLRKYKEKAQKAIAEIIKEEKETGVKIRVNTQHLSLQDASRKRALKEKKYRQFKQNGKF